MGLRPQAVWPQPPYAVCNAAGHLFPHSISWQSRDGILRGTDRGPHVGGELRGGLGLESSACRQSVLKDHPWEPDTEKALVGGGRLPSQPRLEGAEAGHPASGRLGSLQFA